MSVFGLLLLRGGSRHYGFLVGVVVVGCNKLDD